MGRRTASNMHDKKICSTCKKEKILHMDFYMVKGIYKSSCKACVIKRNCKYQKIRNPSLDPEEKREYSRRYYAENKDKFAKYRQDFRDKNGRGKKSGK